LKTIKNEYDKLFEYKNLYEAYKKVQIGKSKKEKIEFEKNLLSNISEIAEELEKETYEVENYRLFIVKEPKIRLIMSMAYRDKIIQRCLCDQILSKLIKSKVIYDNVAVQKEKGTGLGIKRIKQFLREYYNKNKTNKGYILKCDIEKYFYNINHKILKEQLVRYITDKKLNSLLEKIIDSTKDEKLLEKTNQICETYGITKITKEKGLPIGNMTSQYFGVLYMSGLDRYIKEELKIKYYTRYVDDFILIHEDKEYLRNCRQQIQKYVEEKLELRLNKKTMISKMEEGVSYIGYKFYLTNTGKIIMKLSKRNKKQTKKKIKKYAEELKKGEKDIKEISEKIKSWINHAKQGNTYKLRKNVIDMFNKRSGRENAKEKEQKRVYIIRITSSPRNTSSTSNNSNTNIHEQK